MKLPIRFFTSALFIQIIITKSVFTNPNPWIPALWRNNPTYRPPSFDYAPVQDHSSEQERFTRNLRAPNNPKMLLLPPNFEYIPGQDHLSKQERFTRNLRAPHNPRMLSIDLSHLMPGSTEIPLRARHKPGSSNLLGIDISVLSRNPDPKLPIVPSAFQVPGTRKMIMRDTFDPRYDRLPVVTSRPVSIPLREPYGNRARNALVYPFHHLPLNVVTTYHTVMANKKDNQNGNDVDFDPDEKEKKYTANFILHLLYQLSNSQREMLF